MTANRTDNITIVDADLARAEHADALLTMLEAYMLDPMEGGVPPSAQIKRDLVPGLRAHPACHVFLAFRDGAPVGFSICFMGFSTFNAPGACTWQSPVGQTSMPPPRCPPRAPRSKRLYCANL